ncbi:MAG: uroporphyrinogen-III C-methyltransferase [Gammaproteobacteria bacterium]|nr:MAG: uroporphyrinogen-III C-methyltransferase [Gammaproteobacteria bacterium]
MDYLPLFHRLQDQAVVIVGGGAVGQRKAVLLHRAGARLTVICPELHEGFTALFAENSAHQWRQRGYQGADDLHGATLVIAATPDTAVNARVAEDAKALNILVNAVDAPAISTCIFPAIVDRSPIVVAVSSGGVSPVLARRVRQQIETLLPARIQQLAQWAQKWRHKVAASISDVALRRRFWERHLDGAAAEQALAGQEQKADQLLQQALAGAQNDTGDVALIGAGPGDPDLMTFKALRLLQRADVVLYDRLVNAAILDLARRDAERIYVGKARSDHAVQQPDINQLLLDLAKQGKRVARLKGGDPFIFGRGGEELALLIEHNIPFQVVPGITAANGAACYAGIPLTHRDHAQSVRFVTGHVAEGREEPEWATLTSARETLVFYMGLYRLNAICESLIKHGRSPATPAAIVERATTPDQRVLSATLDTLVALVEQQQPKAPTLLIVGDVVTLHSQLSWY